MTFRHVLVATDFGEPALAAVAYARDFALACSARLHLIHVVDDLTAHATPVSAPAIDLSALQHELEAEAREKLDALLHGPLRDAGALPVVLRSARPATAILAYAATAAIDLIVLGTRGRTGFADLFMGSVALQIVRTARCPVLTLRHQTSGFPVALKEPA